MANKKVLEKHQVPSSEVYQSQPTCDEIMLELGWIKGVSNDGLNCYYKPSYKDLTLDFILEEQQGGMVIFFYQDGDYEFVSYDRHFDCIVSPKLHKAIHKKLLTDKQHARALKELESLNEK